MITQAPLLLGNQVERGTNPFVGLWVDAAEKAGFVVAEFTLTTALRTARGRDVIVHLQWPEQRVGFAGEQGTPVRLVRFVAALAVARLRRMKLLVTVHNLASHERAREWPERAVWAALGVLATDVHLMSARSAAEVFALHPRLEIKRRHVVPHGDYRSTLGALPTQAEARSQLDIAADAKVLVSFGRLRAYKGFEELAAVFARTAGSSTVAVVAGAPDSAALVEGLVSAARSDSRLVVTPGEMSDEALHALVTASDLVVLPYRKVLNSGSALLALSLGRRVLVPSTPTMSDLQSNVGTTWVKTFDDELTPESLLDALDGLPAATSRPDLAWCSWDLVSSMLRSIAER